MGIRVMRPGMKEPKMPKRPSIMIIVGSGEHDRQAIEDAETLKEADEIKKDPIRYAKAKKAMED